jgi:YidC/Oxa1 family membrane protein insertase
LETKRLAIFFALSAALLILWPILFPPPKPARPAPGGPPVSESAAPSAASTSGANVPPEAGRAPMSATVAPSLEAGRPAVRVEPISAAEARDVVVSSPLYTARLSNRGGGELLSFVLHRFKDADGQPLDIVRKGLGFPGRTLRLEAKDPFLKRASAALSAVETETVGLETRVRFRYRESDGNGITRLYTFRPGYVATLKVERDGVPNAPVAIVLGPGMGNPSPDELKTQFTKPGSPIVLYATGSVDRKNKDSLKQDLPLGKGLTVVGLEDNYFLAAFLPMGNASALVRPVAVDGTTGKEVHPECEVVLSGAGVLEAELFLGPKDLDVLGKLRPGMDKIIDLGWFAVLVKPLLLTLKAIHGVVRNWGVAIILITILIKLVLYPLTHKQLVSMKRMSKLQPRIEAINVKYATKIRQDPQARLKKNEEVMGLYKAEGINPAGGCLPLLLQMPILIAFYRMLQHSIELRHAPFALWITDLSAKDPYYVTPILMTATMWLQQQMTPATGDAAQRKILAIMPLIFGFLFKDAPSGLVLYWLVQNILTIAQQSILNRYTDLGPSSMKKAS